MRGDSLSPHNRDLVDQVTRECGVSEEILDPPHRWVSDESDPPGYFFLVSIQFNDGRSAALFTHDEEHRDVCNITCYGVDGYPVDPP